MTEKLTDTIDYARIVAATQHAGQFREGSENAIPLSDHTDGAAVIEAQMTDDPDRIKAAHLHDIFEFILSEKYGPDHMLADFNPRVVNFVRLVTFPKQNPGVSWRAPKDAQIKMLLEPERFNQIQDISLADKLERLGFMIKMADQFGADFWKRFNGTPEDILYWYKALRDVVFVKRRMSSNTHDHVEQYKQLVSRLEALGGIALSGAVHSRQGLFVS